MIKLGKYRVALICFLLIFCASFIYAQNINIKDLNQPIPVNNRVKIGTLSNGLKYYIQKNSKPEKRVELRLVVNAGSVLEDEDQQGLAHFVEHMCFNGTKNFNKNELVNYLQSVGVKFGADVNAYTSFDETVYMLTLPTDKPDIVNKGFQILEDWAHNVTFDNQEIDKERGVVIEEWRLGRGAGQRLRDKTFPVLFKDSRYAQRLPIGKKEILENCSYETLKKFYKDWYRPDLMAVVVVGDLDPAEMEAKIKEHFAGIQPVANAKERKVYNVPDHKETLIATATDKEATFAQIQLLFKREPEPIKTYGDFRRTISYQILGGMVSRRLTEISQKPNSPFNFAFAFYTDLLRSKGAYNLSSALNDANIDKALRTLLTENKRVAEYGFNQAELENYKKEILASYETAYNNRDKTDSQNFTFEYVDSYLTNHAIPSIEWQYEYVSKLLPTITVDEINQIAKTFIKDDNFVISITGPTKDSTKQLGEEMVRTALKEINATKVEPYVYKDITQPLMAATPSPGKVVKESKNDALGVTEFVLSNGVKVVLKPTDFKNDEIRMSAFSLGGSSLIKDEDAPSANAAANIIANSGLDNFSDTDLQKLLSGKNTFVSPYIGTLTEGFFAASTPKELETMFQLLNLYFSRPRKDETAFAATMATAKTFSENYLSSPNNFYFNEVQKTLSQNHPRSNVFKKDDVNKISLDKAFEIYKERFADASDFTFIFVGDFEINKIRPLLETYMGSLPSKNKPEAFQDLGIRPPVGIVEREFRKGKDPKSSVTITFTGSLKDQKDGYLIKSLAESLTIKLIEVLREEKGGVYGTSARESISKYPYENYSVTIRFSCAPENVKGLIAAAYEEINKLQQNGPTPQDLGKVKEAQIRELETNFKENFYWLNILQAAYFEKKDLNEITPEKVRSRIDALSIENLRETAQKYLDLDNRIVVVMDPEK